MERTHNNSCYPELKSRISNGKAEKLGSLINDFLKKEGLTMITGQKRLSIMFRHNSKKEYKPANLTMNRLYEVIYTKMVKNPKAKKADHEDLYFAFIGDDYALTWIASFNCYCIDTEVENYGEKFKAYLKRTGILKGETGKRAGNIS